MPSYPDVIEFTFPLFLLLIMTSYRSDFNIFNKYNCARELVKTFSNCNISLVVIIFFLHHKCNSKVDVNALIIVLPTFNLLFSL